MAQPSIHHNPRQNEPNWVEIWTFRVLAATLVVVVIYTYQAYRQNNLTERALEINSRPILSAIITRTITPEPTKYLNVHITINNLGKTPVKASIRASTTYSLQKISSPPLPKAEEVQLSWPNMPIITYARSADLITAGQIEDMKAGRGYLHTRATIIYGPYHTSICSVQNITIHPQDPKRFLLSNDTLCEDRQSNDAD